MFQGNRGGFPSRRPSQDSIQLQKMAPLQHMESLEEWSSAESMAHMNNSLDSTYSPMSSRLLFELM